MRTDPDNEAHVRLVALAVRRVRDVGEVGLMPPGMRERLHEELGRRDAVVPEPVPVPALVSVWRRWRAGLGWVACGAGALVLVGLALRTGLPGSSDDTRGGAGAVESGIASTAPVGLDANGSAAGAARLSGPDDEAEGGGGSAEMPVARVAAPVVFPGGGEADGMSRRRAVGPDGMIRLRRMYIAEGGSRAGGEAAGLLRRFEVVRVAGTDRVQFRDADGSVYQGRVQRAGVGSAAWVFEGRGVQRGTGRSVQITGQFEAEREEGGGGEGRLLEGVFSGSAVVGETRVEDIRARPEVEAVEGGGRGG